MRNSEGDKKTIFEPPPRPKTIDEWQNYVAEWAKSLGWWDDDRPDDAWYMLFVTEVSEAYEEFRKGKKPHEVYVVDGKPEGIGIEIADLLIRIFHFAAYYDLDLPSLLIEKMKYDETREYRHGGKVR